MQRSLDKIAADARIRDGLAELRFLSSSHRRIQFVFVNIVPIPLSRLVLLERHHC